jgi:hypothetical protein
MPPDHRAGSAFRDLLMPLERLLVGGGDARLVVDAATGHNTYLCRPSPCHDTLSFSSSTATSISQRAYDRAGRARDALLQSALACGLHDAFDARIEQMRGELKRHLGLDATGIDVVFSASGTDAQLQALALAQAWLGAPLTTVIAAADQTGSGTAHTARGHHFSDLTVTGSTCRKGLPIDGLAATTATIALPLRDETGTTRSQDDNDARVLGAVERAIADGRKVLLQVMDASKLGCRTPSDSCVDRIRARWPDDVQVVVDACQMRLGRRRLAAYLDRGDMVLLTGSKYFTGPPFSGALLVPARIGDAIQSMPPLAPGLRDYSLRSDWPTRWAALRAQFSDRANFGQWLRWEAALEEIGAYYAIPDAFRDSAIRQLGAGIARIIASSASLRALPLPPALSADDDEFSLPTIFAFTLERRGATLSLRECKDIHRALACALPDETSAAAAQICLIGQPVGWGGERSDAIAALRICIGARHVTECWSADAEIAWENLRRQLDHVAIVVAKIEWLLRQDQLKIQDARHGN